MRRALCAVALLALACLLVRGARVGLAGEYIDPIGKITAQDEALYGHAAIVMARQKMTYREARKALKRSDGFLRRIIDR